MSLYGVHSVRVGDSAGLRRPEGYTLPACSRRMVTQGCRVAFSRKTHLMCYVMNFFVASKKSVEWGSQVTISEELGTYIGRADLAIH
jgi:hypothetical protein